MNPTKTLQGVTAREALAVIGVGYVGLPLASAFGRVRPTIAFDIDAVRVQELTAGRDRTGELDPEDLAAASYLVFTANEADIKAASIYVVAVPTPIDAEQRPDLEPLRRATETVGRALSIGDLVIFESTVYPGATEEVCVPILEEVSGLSFNVDFFVGYSPERINPGDRAHGLSAIIKVTSGSTPETAIVVDRIYREIASAGTHSAPSIRVAEAAKVIENTQRDVNIALVNELAMLFHRLDLDTHDVLAAASTKWNFLPFSPGLVGGHCIGVDPYYLMFKALEVGHSSDVILAGRRTNDAMGRHVAERLVLELVRAGRPVRGARCLVLGLAFKENCRDLRNTGVVSVVRTLEEFGLEVDVCDPRVDAGEAMVRYGLQLVSLDEALDGTPDAAVLAVAHTDFAGIGERLRRAVGEGVIFDVKGVLPREIVDGRL